MPPRSWLVLLISAILLPTVPASAEESLHTRIDAFVAAKGQGKAISPVADDAEFVRRVYLDFNGRIPSLSETRSFLDDPTPDKRTRLVDKLLASDEYPPHMADVFHVLFMERLGDSPEWTKYLQTSFGANKPWDKMAREMLRGVPVDESSKGASFFYTKRLENYGQNPVDYPGLTRDVGRLFLGKDFRCCQCHDHLFIDDYKQQDFQGLHVFFQNTFLQKGNGMVGEKPTTAKLGYMSVFKKEPKEVGPRVPGFKEIELPVIEKGKEYLTPPVKKTGNVGALRFSPLAQLAEQLPVADNSAFVRNIVNRLWFVMMGRGLVHPLDLHHKANPPSHPEVLDLLAAEFVAHHFDMKWLLRELALTQTYQRSCVLPENVKKQSLESFLTAIEKRLSADQLLWSVLEATGERQRLMTKAESKNLDAAKVKFVKAFANSRREPEDEFAPSLKSALFLLNDDLVLSWLTPRPGNLIERLGKENDNTEVAEELYLSFLSRRPTAEERDEVVRYLTKNAEQRTTALGQLAWALLASTEFCVNH